MASSVPSAPDRPVPSVNRGVALAFGVVYALVGVAGFFATGSEPFADEDGESLLGFDVTVLHNLVHLAIGIALIGASRTQRAARTANLVIGGTYLLLGAAGPALDDTTVDVLGLNGADHVLHLLSGLVLVAVALLADRSRAEASRAR